MNSLFVQSDASEMKGVYVAPEIEYAFAEGKAFELEFPTVDGKIKTFKTALQFELPNWWGDITGTQIMHEKVNGKSVNETTLLLLSGKRLNEKWSILFNDWKSLCLWKISSDQRFEVTRASHRERQFVL